MLFQSIVPVVFSAMNLATNKTASEQRKKEAQKRLDYFEDAQLGHLEEVLGQFFSQPEKMQLCVLNITRKIVLNLAQVYREPPAREVEGSEQDKTLYQDMIESAALDVKLKQAQRLTKLLKTVLLRPVWRNSRMDLDILTGDILDVEVGDTPEDLRQVIITHYGANARVEDVTYSRWTPETYQRLDYRGNVIESKPNPYGLLPFVPCWDRPPLGEFWLPGGDDLISIQEAINTKITDLLYLIRQQSFGVGYLKGVKGSGQEQVDPGTLIELPENGEVGFVAQQAEIMAVIEAIKFLVGQAAVMHGLSAALLSLDPSAASGVSKLADSKELQEMRADDVALWRLYERRLFEVMRAVWNAHNTRQISDKATIRLDFADQAPTQDPKAQAETWDRLIEMGVISPVDVAMELNPDLTTREDALSHLLQVQEERAQLNELKA